MSDRLAQLEKLHAADPHDPFVTYGVALEHAKAQRFEDAIAWLDKTLSLDRHYCYAYYQKAKAYSELGEDDQAKATLHAGIAAAREARNPDAAHAAEEMAVLLESL